MDAISKLLGHDVHATSASPALAEIVSKKSGILKASAAANRRSGASGNDLGKSNTNPMSRRKKSEPRNEMNKPNSGGAAQPEQSNFFDETRFKTTVAPGKKGGTFDLPFDANITIPEGFFGKKDTITCRVSTPQTRWQNCPTYLQPGEHVNSEIYSFKCSNRYLKTNIVINIPFKAENYEFNDINVRGKLQDHIEWTNVEFTMKEVDGRPFVELDVSKLGTFLVTATPKTESFEVTPQGCLYQARLSRHVTVRFPKRATDQELQCSLRIIPIPQEKVHVSKEQYLTDSAHIKTVTEFIELTSDVHSQFMRPVTIKLPLPVDVESDVEGGGEAASVSKRHQDIAVLHKSTAGWELVESSYKFTRTTVSFDVKELSRFCVMQCLPGRQKKMKDAVALVEGMCEREKGEICLFLCIKNKSWMGVIEVFPKYAASTKLSTRKAQGFTIVARTQGRHTNKLSHRFPSRRLPLITRDANTTTVDDSFELYEGLTWSVDIQGDVKIGRDSDIRDNSDLRYFSRLNESYRTFYFEPPDMDPRPLEAHVNLVPVGLTDETQHNKLTFTFKIEIEESTMVEYLVPGTPTPPMVLQDEIIEEKSEEPNLDFIYEAPKEQDIITLPPATPKLQELPSNAVRRLTTFKKPVRVPEKESKAITGRSLMTIARLVPEGLTLAVHLQLPDSTITGIGFDALSNNLNMSDVSYKILLYWKRQCKDKQMGAVRQLTDALKEMRYHVIADAVMECHLRHKEFTQDCLQQENDSQ